MPGISAHGAFADPLIISQLNKAVADVSDEIEKNQISGFVNDAGEKDEAGQELDINESDYNIEIHELPENVEIDDSSVFLSGMNCGLFLNYEEIKIEDKVVIIVQNESSKQGFLLYPGSRFVLYYKNINGELNKHKVYYSGINFKHTRDRFIVLHVCNT